MAIYERRHDNEDMPVGEYRAYYTLKELPLYGSDRLGESKLDKYVIEKNIKLADWDKLDQVGFSREDFYTRYSEYKNWLVPQESSEELTVDDEDYTVSIASLSELDNTTNTSSTLLNFVGKTGSGVTVGEEVDPKTGDREVAFYATTAEAYWGNGSIGLVYDKNGLLMPGVSTMVNASGKSKPVVMRKPGSQTVWYLFTTSEAGTLLRHTIDMSEEGNGTTGSPLGELTVVNEPVVIPAGELSGTRLLGLEDQANGRVVLVTTAYDATNNKTKLYSILYSEEHSNGLLRLVSEKTGYGAKAEELVLSKDGKELAWYHYKERQGWFDQHEADIYTYTINGDLSVSSDEHTISITDGTIEGSGLDYSHNKGYLYYEQRSLTEITGQSTDKGTLTYNLTSNVNVSLLADKAGEIRRGQNDQEVFIADQCSTTLTKLSEGASGSYSVSSVTMPATGLLTGHLPSQVEKLYDPNAFNNLFARYVDQKLYELKDHLGNVMATISDRRESSISGSTITNTPELKYYGEYYPFGMTQPGRTYTLNPGYRYGYNGQERLEEIALGHYTAEYWEYDSRLGRRWNLDPKPTIGVSDYACLLNSPIIVVDPLGDEIIIIADGPATFSTETFNALQKLTSDKLKLRKDGTVVIKKIVDNPNLKEGTNLVRM